MELSRRGEESNPALVATIKRVYNLHEFYNFLSLNILIPALVDISCHKLDVHYCVALLYIKKN
jgi:hypothetical protein